MRNTIPVQIEEVPFIDRIGESSSMKCIFLPFIDNTIYQKVCIHYDNYKVQLCTKDTHGHCWRCGEFVRVKRYFVPFIDTEDTLWIPQDANRMHGRWSEEYINQPKVKYLCLDKDGICKLHFSREKNQDYYIKKLFYVGRTRLNVFSIDDFTTHDKVRNGDREWMNTVYEYMMRVGYTPDAFVNSLEFSTDMEASYV